MKNCLKRSNKILYFNKCNYNNIFFLNILKIIFSKINFKFFEFNVYFKIY